MELVINFMEDGSLCIWCGSEVTVGQEDQLLKLKTTTTTTTTKKTWSGGRQGQTRTCLDKLEPASVSHYLPSTSILGKLENEASAFIIKLRTRRAQDLEKLEEIQQEELRAWLLPHEHAHPWQVQDATAPGALHQPLGITPASISSSKWCAKIFLWPFHNYEPYKLEIWGNIIPT